MADPSNRETGEEPSGPGPRLDAEVADWADARVADEIGLDPDDWEEFRDLAHRMVDDMVDWLAEVRERPVWRPVPPEIRARLDEPVPTGETPLSTVYDRFREDILPYPSGNVHPRFWGWVKGTGTAVGMMADMLAAGMNNHVAGFDQSAAIVERRVIAWLISLMGMPEDTSGILVGGCSMANFVGLAVARQARAGWDVRSEGVRAGPPLTIYSSAETHSSVRKAVELQGLGDEAYRRIPVGPDYRIDLDVLERAIAIDRAAGRRPLCVVGNAGTVNTGAIDDLTALADLCERERIWFHVDGAFGALCAWSESLRPLVRGIERADSLAFDLHKWGWQPYDTGCALVRHAAAHRSAFSVSPDYLAAVPRGIMAGGLPFSELGVQLSRGFRALKVWMALKTHGSRKIARIVEQNVAQARYLAKRVEAESRLELCAPVPLNVVCFRYVGDGLGPEDLDEVNREILMRIQESGEAVPSSTVLRGRFVLRAAIVNHRSRCSDFDRLAKQVVEVGDDVRSS